MHLRDRSSDLFCVYGIARSVVRAIHLVDLSLALDDGLNELELDVVGLALLLEFSFHFSKLL